jgi:hypothetical protein
MAKKERNMMKYVRNTVTYQTFHLFSGKQLTTYIASLGSIDFFLGAQFSPRPQGRSTLRGTSLCRKMKLAADRSANSLGWVLLGGGGTEMKVRC